MTKKIFRSIFIVASVVLFSSLIVVVGVLYSYFTSIQKTQLRAQSALVSHGVETEGTDYFKGLNADGYRLTWVAANGTVLYDNEADAATMENHAEREEIKEALEFGVGESERTSATLAEQTLYRAQRLKDGTVLRVSITQYTIFTLVLGTVWPLILVLVTALILSGILARRISRRIVQPLNTIDLDKPLENDTYEELSPLLTRIENQHRQIEKQISELTLRQTEFIAVTGNMKEGLILLNDKGTVLSINSAAANLFGTDTDCVGSDILTVDRSPAMQNLIREAQNGRHAEAVMELAGGEYQINASPVISGKTVTGVVILAFDITERVQAEQLRREFSANVSHELKTPLHSIMGSAELIENGIVKREDLTQFAGRIRSEAGRLVMLIDDIIRLSQLDEGGDMPFETVDLKALADEAAQLLSGAAAARNVTVSVHGANVSLRGVRRYLYDIVYNLCDNAVKYNVDGGRVDVTVTEEKECVTLAVADTGIGISKEHQHHVFERFYRVDKSHSKETGGTGLGLSIVKHAAQVHHAAIELQSQPGGGTTIKVHFPKDQEESD